MLSDVVRCALCLMLLLCRCRFVLLFVRCCELCAICLLVLFMFADDGPCLLLYVICVIDVCAVCYCRCIVVIVCYSLFSCDICLPLLLCP